MGIVPDNPLAREFRDQAGWLHQRLAQVADLVVLVVAGLPLLIKGAIFPGAAVRDRGIHRWHADARRRTP